MITWIHIDKQLPKEGQDVLIFQAKGRDISAKYEDGVFNGYLENPIFLWRPKENNA